MLPLVPVRELFAVSVAVMVCVPAVVRNDAEHADAGCQRGVGGNSALPSLLVNWTVPV